MSCRVRISSSTALRAKEEVAKVCSLATEAMFAEGAKAEQAARDAEAAEQTARALRRWARLAVAGLDARRSGEPGARRGILISARSLLRLSSCGATPKARTHEAELAGMLEAHLVDGKLKTLLVHRKGATRAFPPHHPLIPVDYQVRCPPPRPRSVRDLRSPSPPSSPTPPPSSFHRPHRAQRLHRPAARRDPDHLAAVLADDPKAA